MQLCSSLNILWPCLSFWGLEWKFTISSPVANAEFSKLAGILLSAALEQHHHLGFEIAQLAFHQLCFKTFLNLPSLWYKNKPFVCYRAFLGCDLSDIYIYLESKHEVLGGREELLFGAMTALIFPFPEIHKWYKSSLLLHVGRWESLHCRRGTPNYESGSLYRLHAAPITERERERERSLL